MAPGSGDAVLARDLEPDLAEIVPLAEAIEAFGAVRGLPLDAIGQVNLVLDELITNIITYASAAAAPAIHVELHHADDALIVRLSDTGAPFDITAQVPPPDLKSPVETRRIGGLGVHFARSLMDAVDYARVENRNCVTLVKRLGEPS